ncbi:hypothetical protein [Actinopolymorpha singaporensis]|uniref:hypothetical protein n=1 Tax=Actinopolymorpha singaporensis TaxID=117157 RepID=UPI001A7E1428|nr:hypothetical protein [Actinopolymorpha singaporensis]
MAPHTSGSASVMRSTITRTSLSSNCPLANASRTRGSQGSVVARATYWCAR